MNDDPTASRNAKLNFQQRFSDSPFVERIWRTEGAQAGSFISMAFSHWQMCVWQQNGKINLTMRGPETQATRVDCPADAEFLGIVFRLGTVMPHLPASGLVDADITLPDATSQSFWLNSSVWEFPNYENADTFVDRLVREGLLIREPVIEAALQEQPQPISVRSVQRHFTRAVGLTHGAVDQIERARYATLLLKSGVSILDTVDQAGYADQPHLTRSLKHFIGQTPAQLLATNAPEQLSFLFTPRMMEKE